jgi:hypothetical protein
MPYEGDCRFETRVRLQSEKRESLLCEDDTCQGKDLSDFLGTQGGNYRIQIRLLDGKKQRFL